MTWLLTDNDERELAPDAVRGDGIWLSPSDMAAATGWELKPEGLCQGEVCVPIPAQRTDEFLQDGQVNAAAFWRHMGWPVVSGDGGTAWILGAGADTRGAALQSLDAPDFELPDLNGTPHKLSGERGKKVFLATWASW